MLGFLLHDADDIDSQVAIGACQALQTYRYQRTDSIDRLRIHYFQNSSPNCYFVSNERFSIGVVGTLIFNHLHGTAALENLVKSLLRGRTLVDEFKALQGPYNLILVDRLANEVSLLNSREGLRNCYVRLLPRSRAYSTNLLLLAAVTSASPDADGIREFIHIGATMAGKTIFEGIEHVSPASLHLYRNGRWTASRLWRLTPSPPDRDLSRSRATSTMTDMFVRNFEFTKPMSQGTVAADLTGGTDSRTVLSCLMSQHPQPVATTLGPQAFVDVRIARAIASKLGIEYFWQASLSAQLTTSLVERAVEIADGNACPISVAQGLPYYEEKARRFSLITGGGGGPLFKDHYWLFEFNRVGLHREPHWNRIAKYSLVSHAIEDNFFDGFNDRIIDKLTTLFHNRSLEVKGTNNQKLDFVYFDLKTPAFAGQSFSLTTQFTDVFHPMLDGTNVQYSINLPPEIRIRNILQFGMIRALKPELSWILTDAGLPTIPPVGLYSWLRAFRLRRYVMTPLRKIRTGLFGTSGAQTNMSTDIDSLKALGYFDLLTHSSLAFAPMISASKLAAFRDAPTKQPHQNYLVACLALQLFFDRVKELSRQTGKSRLSSSSA